MSQVLKKPVNMPVRKRLKPTVNLNVASRRRKETPVTDVSAEVLPEPSKTNYNKIEETITRNKSEEIQLKEKDSVLNTTYESDKSFSSEKTLLLQDYLGQTQERSDKSHHEICASRDSSFRSVSSSVATVLLQNENISKKPLKDLLEQSIDSIDEFDGFGTSNIVTKNGSSVASCSHRTVDETADNEIHNVENSLKNSIISDASKSDTQIDQTEHDQEKSTEALTLISDHESRKSVSSDVPVTFSRGGRNVDLESLNDDDSLSTVSIQSESRQSDYLPSRKYKRKFSTAAKQLAEARRDFEIRFSDKKPERSSLRMFDLIYYNPASNPMKSTVDNPKEFVVSSPSEDLDSSRAIEEDVDNPAEKENTEEENESGIPAPRVKVGPNGEIVLDEQSLVIETTQSKKSRQEIANLTVVVDTGSNTTYHTYSKKKRARNEWSVKETVRFYKALQTLGTDFSLMQSLFPSRSRLDLKSKFKKEERVNGHLIEKALRCPSLFDISELEKEQVVEENKEIDEKKKKKASKQRGKKRSLRSLGFDEEDVGPSLKNKKKGIKSSRQNHGKDTGKENMETLPNECTSDEELEPSVTEQGKIEGPKGVTERRSSRILNGKTLNAAVENRNDFLEAGVDLLESSENEEENDPENTVKKSEEIAPTVTGNFDVNNVPPGSLVIVTAQHPDNPGYQICNVFMVQERSDRDNAESQSTANPSSTQSNASDTPMECTEDVAEPS